MVEEIGSVLEWLRPSLARSNDQRVAERLSLHEPLRIGSHQQLVLVDDPRATEVLWALFDTNSSLL